ncbi:mechanosensitive ion channel family protein [Mucilaginibacter conchicola]|uniref:Mechanosensitive ion channel family protein n=1 Tax=Mucilaginibacter conchicola TaxID=2303333 RepID=A0A372P161_9SPHI|nr:mechanosensitive ion channel domain-containing protein [Mucilaginibacter conchicola]RFZ95669.1 mechanosensitive ion channel family protein [Mucilaginibacter conchicola]
MELETFYNTFHHWLINRGPVYAIGIIFFLVGLWVISFIRARLLKRLSHRKVSSSLQPFILSLSITAMYVLLTVSVLNYMGFELTLINTVIGALGVAAGLALSGTLQNFAGGVLILLLKPFAVGDSIKAQGQEGGVTSIQLFYTVLLTADNKTVIIPNGKLFNEVIVNITREHKRRLDFELKLGYAVDIEQVKGIINDIIKSTPEVLTDPITRVGVSALEGDGMRFIVNVWVEPSNYLSTKIYLQETIVKSLSAAGVKLPGTGDPSGAELIQALVNRTNS